MEATVTTNGWIVIPSKVRRKLGIKAGTRVIVEVNEDRAQIILTPVTREYIKRMAGKFRGAGLREELEASRARDLEREEFKINPFKTKLAADMTIERFRRDDPRGLNRK